MARNAHFTHTGQRARSLPVPDGTAPGSPVKVGSIIGVTITARVPTDPAAVDAVGRDLFIDYGNGNAPGYATVARDGSWDLIVGGAAITSVGSPVYIDADNKLSSAAATGSSLFGYALETKAANDQKTHVELALV